MNELKGIINKAIKEFLKTTDYTTVFGKMEKDIVAWHKREVEKLIPEDYFWFDFDDKKRLKQCEKRLGKISDAKYKHFAELDA